VRFCEHESGICVAACDKSRDVPAQLLLGDISLFPDTPSQDRAKLCSKEIFLELAILERRD
jgi:hypothetical protein